MSSMVPDAQAKASRQANLREVMSISQMLIKVLLLKTCTDAAYIAMPPHAVKPYWSSRSTGHGLP